MKDKKNRYVISRRRGKKYRGTLRPFDPKHDHVRDVIGIGHQFLPDANLIMLNLDGNLPPAIVKSDKK